MITIAEIRKTVEQYLQLSYGSSNVNSENSIIVLSRQLIYYFAKKYTTESDYAISDQVGNKSYTLVNYSVKRINLKYKTDLFIKKCVDDIEIIINPCNDKNEMKNKIIALSGVYFGQTSLQKKLIESIFCCD